MRLTVSCSNCNTKIKHGYFDSEVDGVIYVGVCDCVKKPKERWISVKDKLPAYEEDVIVAVSGSVFIGFRESTDAGGEHWEVLRVGSCRAVTDWMPIPELSEKSFTDAIGLTKEEVEQYDKDFEEKFPGLKNQTIKKPVVPNKPFRTGDEVYGDVESVDRRKEERRKEAIADWVKTVTTEKIAVRCVYCNRMNMVLKTQQDHVCNICGKEFYINKNTYEDVPCATSKENMYFKKGEAI